MLVVAADVKVFTVLPPTVVAPPTVEPSPASEEFFALPFRYVSVIRRMVCMGAGAAAMVAEGWPTTNPVVGLLT